MRRSLLVAALCLWVAILSVACWSGSTQSVTGVLVEVQAQGLMEVDQFSVRDGDGEVWVFHVSDETVDEDGRPLTAGHLRQDMAMIEPVRVEFRRDGERLLATRLSH